MKNLLLTLSLIISAISYSQVIFSENFDADTVLPDGWAQHNVDGLPHFAPNFSFYGSNAWSIRPNSTVVNPVGNVANASCFHNNPGGGGVANDWMVTPAINIPSTGTTSFELEAMATAINKTDGFKVYVSVTGNTVADFSDAPVLNVTDAAKTMTLYSANLGAYAGQTVYIAIQYTSEWTWGVAVDNFVVRQLVPNDISLTSATLNRYSLINTDNSLTFSVKNDGSNVVTSMDVSWNDGTNHTSTIACNIAQGQEAAFTHPVTVSYATAVGKTITVSVDQVNTVADPNMGNNTATKLFNTVSQQLPRKVVFEEGTGTWCGWCPRGAVAMEHITTLHPDNAIAIAVHNNDPMTVIEYLAGADFANYPSVKVDRIGNSQFIDNGSSETYYNNNINRVVPATVSASSSCNGSQLTVNTSGTFYSPFSAATYRFAVILTEDNVKGTTPSYNQTNAYSFNSMDQPLEGAGHNWQNEPDPVPAANMEYDHVGRALLGGFNGASGSVPAVLTAGQTVNYTFNYTIPASMNRGNMHAVAVLIDNATGEIINADQISLSGVGLNENAETINMLVFPNPASSETTVSFEGKGGSYTVNIIDITGRVYATEAISNAAGMQSVKLNTSDLKAGVYMVNVANESGTYTQNMIVE